MYGERGTGESLMASKQKSGTFTGLDGGTGRRVGTLNDGNQSDPIGMDSEEAAQTSEDEIQPIDVDSDNEDVAASGGSVAVVDSKASDGEADGGLEDVDLLAELAAASDGALLGVEMVEQGYQPDSIKGSNGDSGQNTAVQDDLEASEASFAVNAMLGVESEDSGETETSDETETTGASDPSNYIAKLAAALSQSELTIDGLRDEIVQMTRITQELMDELKIAKDKLMQAVSDQLSFRQRADREKQDTVQYSNERLLRELLPSLDSFERAVEHLDTDSSDPFASGVRMVRQQMLQSLNRFNLESFRSQGVTFDPARHEACAEVESQEYAPGHVVNVIKTGYLLSGRLLRPALVTVAKAAKPKSDEPVVVDGELADAEADDDQAVGVETAAVDGEGNDVELTGEDSSGQGESEPDEK